MTAGSLGASSQIAILFIYVTSQSVAVVQNAAEKTARGFFVLGWSADRVVEDDVSIEVIFF